MALHGAPTLVIVLGDFGRAASLTFAVDLSRFERQAVSRALPAGAAFYDEYRRIRLHVIGELGWLKAPALAPYVTADRPLDERVLVGFPGGLTIDDVVPRMALLLLEALAGPLRRGCDRFVAALPCNTLAPAARRLEALFTDPAALGAALDDAGLSVGPELAAVAGLLAGGASIGFPTVPAAVVETAVQRGAQAILPLGTPGTPALYERAAVAHGSRVRVVRPAEQQVPQILDAIEACIDGQPGRREAARANLQQIATLARQSHGETLAVVEACTDLDLGVGWSSGACYARRIVEHVYGG